MGQARAWRRRLPRVEARAAAAREAGAAGAAIRVAEASGEEEEGVVVAVARVARAAGVDEAKAAASARVKAVATVAALATGKASMVPVLRVATAAGEDEARVLSVDEAGVMVNVRRRVAEAGAAGVDEARMLESMGASGGPHTPSPRPR